MQNADIKIVKCFASSAYVSSEMHPFYQMGVVSSRIVKHFILKLKLLLDNCLTMLDYYLTAPKEPHNHYLTKNHYQTNPKSQKIYQPPACAFPHADRSTITYQLIIINHLTNHQLTNNNGGKYARRKRRS
jgi:hypothetical protein